MRVSLYVNTFARLPVFFFLIRSYCIGLVQQLVLSVGGGNDDNMDTVLGTLQSAPNSTDFTGQQTDQWIRPSAFRRVRNAAEGFGCLFLPSVAPQCSLLQQQRSSGDGQPGIVAAG